MAGIFGFFDYTKPGPGVQKDAPPKAPILLFFELLQRKFWNLIKLNMLFCIFNIPAFILGLLMLVIFFPDTSLVAGNSDTNSFALDILTKISSLSIIMSIPLITTGPSQAGFTYVLRNYAREEPAFLWSDFKEHALKNLKQATIISVIDFIVTFVMLWSIKAYMALSSGSIVLIVGLVLTIMIFVVFAIMHMYIYPLMVTFSLSIKQIYKNALIFSIVKLPMNILIGIICVLIVLLTYGWIIPFNPVLGVIIYFFLTASLIGFITNFHAFRKIKKYMIPDETGEEEEDGEEEEEDTKDADANDSVEQLPEGENQDNTNDDGPTRYY